MPCTQCIAREISEDCKREVVLVKGSTIRDDNKRLYDRDEIMTVEKLLEENKRLRMEVQLYQRVGMRSRPLQPGLQEASTSIRSRNGEGDSVRNRGSKRSRGEGLKLRQVVENDLERMATITNLLEMGRERNVRSSQGNQGELRSEARICLLSAKKNLLHQPLDHLLSFSKSLLFQIHGYQIQQWVLKWFDTP